MGIAFSIDLQEDMKELLAIDHHYGGDEIRQLAQEVLQLVEDPSNKEKASSLLLGLATGLRGNHYVAIFSLLELASNGDWIFQQISENSVAFFEVMVMLLKSLGNKKYGEFEWRARICILALAQLCLRCARKLRDDSRVNTSIPVTAEEDLGIERTVVDPPEKTNNALGVITNVLTKTMNTLLTGTNQMSQNGKKMARQAGKIFNRDEKRRERLVEEIIDITTKWSKKTTDEQAVADWKQLYSSARKNLVESSPLETEKFPRDIRYLKNLILELSNFVSQSNHKAASYLKKKRRGPYFGLKYNHKVVSNHEFAPSDPFNFSMALMSIVLSGEETETLLLDRFIGDTHQLKMNFKVLRIAPHAEVNGLVKSLLTPTDSLGGYVCALVRDLSVTTDVDEAIVPVAFWNAADSADSNSEQSIDIDVENEDFTKALPVSKKEQMSFANKSQWMERLFRRLHHLGAPSAGSLSKM